MYSKDRQDIPTLKNIFKQSITWKQTAECDIKHTNT